MSKQFRGYAGSVGAAACGKVDGDNGTWRIRWREPGEPSMALATGTWTGRPGFSGHRNSAQCSRASHAKAG